jgi:antitoxin component YwqK of YwqJK toxin-antitoxin module
LSITLGRNRLTNRNVIILLILILSIIFIGEVFTEENIQTASYNKRHEKIFFNSSNDRKNKSKASPDKDRFPYGFHIVSIRYDNGRLKERGGIYRNQDGSSVRHGKWSFWSEDGQKIAEKYYKRGQPIGTWLYWDRNGKLIKKKSYTQN